MQFNLKTTLQAFPKLSPSILKDYVTKEELENENFVNHTELSTILSDFVKDVENGENGTIYGRVNGKWVPIFDVPSPIDGILCWGMIDSQTLNGQQILSDLNRMTLVENVIEYSIEYQPTQSGYFWFASTVPITGVVANSGLSYQQILTDCPNISVIYKGNSLTFYCYRTQKLVALPGIPYKFQVSI